MLTINPINNENRYNPRFSAKIDYSSIYKEMEKISLKQEEKILPKVNKFVKRFSKFKFPKVQLPKIQELFSNFLFKHDFISPIDIKYYNDPNCDHSSFCLKEYANNAYKKYRISDQLPDILVEERLPNGIKQIYEDSPIATFIREKYFPDGTVKMYKFRSNNIFSPYYVWGEQLADGRKIIYDENGKIRKSYPASDKRTLKEI